MEIKQRGGEDVREISRDEKRRNGKTTSSKISQSCRLPSADKRPRGLPAQGAHAVWGATRPSAGLCATVLVSLLSIPVSLPDLDVDILSVESSFLHKQRLFGKSQP